MVVGRLSGNSGRSGFVVFPLVCSAWPVSGLRSRADLFNFPTKALWAELERRLSRALLPHPCGSRGSTTHRSQSGCRPGGVFLGRRHEQGSHPGHQRGGCLRANTCRCVNQTHVLNRCKATKEENCQKHLLNPQRPSRGKEAVTTLTTAFLSNAKEMHVPLNMRLVNDAVFNHYKLQGYEE